MLLCRLILTEMDKHDDGWPFLKPVNFKQFPAYKKYIRQPMDFTTMKNKLRDNQYVFEIMDIFKIVTYSRSQRDERRMAILY